MSKKSHNKAPINKRYFGVGSKNQAKCNFHSKHTTNDTFSKILSIPKFDSGSNPKSKTDTFHRFALCFFHLSKKWNIDNI